LSATAEQRRLLLEQLLQERIQPLGTDAAMGDPPPDHPFARSVNPSLARLLHGLALDKRYVRGSGCWLEDERGDRYLDFTAAYGALPFGHNPPEIWDALCGVRDSGEPTFAQPSLLDSAGTLAAALLDVAPPGLRRVTFANSGAEAVEAAIKMARAATGRLGILATWNAFHGKTLGALSATGRLRYQRPFGAPAPGFQHVPYGDADAVERALDERADEVAAVIVEPIQGEGGIVIPPQGYLRALRAACSRRNVLLIIDEVQTGLGRTGSLFACDVEGVTPDAITIAKALGGGLVPAAAVLSGPAASSEEFDLRHTSTFAGNALACRVALRTLELLTRDDHRLVRWVSENGRRLADGLEVLRRRHPAILTAVRGRGYLLGVELTDDFRAFRRQSLLGSLAEQETLAAVVCSFMLNAEHIRVAPTFFGARVLRVEPPLIAGWDECQLFLGALERTLDTLAACDTARLLGPLAGRHATPSCEPKPQPPEQQRSVYARPGEPRFGFVVHPLTIESYCDLDSALTELSATELETLVGRLADSRLAAETQAIVIGSGRIESPAGATAYGEFIGIPYTARELLDLRQEDAVVIVRDAVQLARDRGAEVVGLGAFSSIVTRNGLDLLGVGVPLTTGNAFTVAATAQAIEDTAATRGPELPEATVAIIGATGSIGRALSMLLAERAGRLVLVGSAANPGRTHRRLEGVATAVADHLTRPSAVRPQPGQLAASIAECPTAKAALARMLADGSVELAFDPDSALRRADFVVTCTSTPTPLFSASALKPGATVCDVSQPSNVASSVASARTDVLVVEGGIIKLPGRRDLGVSFGLGPGLVYACMAETMLLALERRYDGGALGADLPLDSVERLARLARQHGFRVLGPERSVTR
jgi:acetylornithine/succinyldiaminopimelate/putrescine aminotransferase/predicted amino acid dehydrogenase